MEGRGKERRIVGGTFGGRVAYCCCGCEEDILGDDCRRPLKRRTGMGVCERM